MKREKWRVTLDNQVQSDLLNLEANFKKLFGRYPSKSELINFLVKNAKDKKKSKGRLLCF